MRRVPAHAILAICAATLACRAPDPTGGGGAPLDSETSADTAGPAHTGDTAAVEVNLYPDQVYDCTQGVPPGPFTGTPVPNVYTTEDFTFDSHGYLIAAAGEGRDVVVRYTRDGLATGIAPGIGSLGFDLLPDGGIVIGDPDTGQLVRLDLVTGDASALGTVEPGVSGIDIGSDGRIYSSSLSSGRVSATDPVTGLTETVAQLADATYGVGLSPDEQVLYVASYPEADAYLYASTRTSGGWSEPVALASPGKRLGGVATDLCGNVYVVEPFDCEVWRVAADGSTEFIGDAGRGSTYCASVEFGSGVGGWEATSLFVSTYQELVEFEVGVPGRDR